MSRARRSFSTADKAEDINISPLIDMVFILLIFVYARLMARLEKRLGLEEPEA